MAALCALGGWRLPVLVPLWGSILFAVGGFFLPDMALHSQAEQRRASFRYALGSFFDLVVITLAGGGGVQSALHDSAQVGQGWAYAQLQDALASSSRSGTPWAALGRLGEDLGIEELGESGSPWRPRPAHCAATSWPVPSRLPSPPRRRWLSPRCCCSWGS
jgi:Flp pilus assembly protein TadB